MKLPVFSLLFLAALFYSLQLTTAAFPGLAEICKRLDPQQHLVFCQPPPGPDPRDAANATTGNGTGTAAGNATEGSAGAARSLPIIGSTLPIGKLLPIR